MHFKCQHLKDNYKDRDYLIQNRQNGFVTWQNTQNDNHSQEEETTHW